ncbi:hypothetical protein OG21DRAFT_1490018 [Imleria badia]|nr:hypothetical protein OG21DRAFT_1490018 [Imleria badia]
MTFCTFDILLSSYESANEPSVPNLNEPGILTHEPSIPTHEPGVPTHKPSISAPLSPTYSVEKLKKNWAKGICFDFLTGHLEGYKVACLVSASRSQEYLDNVINCYFQWFPWRIPLNEEPPVKAASAPNVEVLITVEAKKKQCKIQSMRKTSFRDWIMWEHFAKLPESERTRYAELAKQEALQAMDTWTHALKSPPSKDPIDCQDAINHLSTFAGPLLASMYDILGMHITLLVGGPELCKGGRITVLL